MPQALPIKKPNWIDVAPTLLDEHGLDELTPDMARHWSLVLYSRRVPHRVRQGWPGLKLLVPPGREQEALDELRAFLLENPPSRVVLPDFRRPAFSWGELPGVLWSLSLVTLFLTATGAENGLGVFLVDWHAKGEGDTGLMAAGQWWRAVTSLTLHADIAHLMGNVCLGGTFLVLLATEVGLGAAWFLSLSGAVLANLAKVLLQGAGYRFLGASTMVFASVGVLAGVRLVRLQRNLRWRRILPFAAGLMILAFLGVGDQEDARRIDLAGHFMGFGSGFALGLAYAALERVTNKSGRPFSRWLGGAATAMCVLAWAWALLA
jgi:membrane associated rhomboid family serine protease